MEQTITIYNNYPQIGVPGKQKRRSPWRCSALHAAEAPRALLGHAGGVGAQQRCGEPIGARRAALVQGELFWGRGLDLPREKGNFTQFNQQTWEFIVNLC